MSTTSTSTHTTPKLSPEFNNSQIPSTAVNTTALNQFSLHPSPTVSNPQTLPPASQSFTGPSGNSHQMMDSPDISPRFTFAKSPNSAQQLKEYKDLHKIKQSQNKSNRYSSKSPRSKNDHLGPSINDDIKKSPMQLSEDVDPFLRKYIKNKSPLQFSQNSTRDPYSKYLLNNLNLFNSNKNLKVLRRRKSRSLNQLVNSRTTSSQASINSLNSSPPGNDQKTKTHNEPSGYVKTTDIKVDGSKTLPEEFVKYLPSDFVDCNLNDLMVLVSRMLNNLINLNNKLVPDSISSSKKNDSKNNPLLTRYHSRSPPNISPISYLSRLIKFNNFSNGTLLTTIYYIDLLSYNYQPYFTLNSWTVHRFLLVATMISQKSLEDFFYTNDHYAKVGGVALNELNCLELDFLTRINWSCVPSKQVENGKSSIKYSKEVLDLYYKQLIELTGKNAKKDEFTYLLENTASINRPDFDRSYINMSDMDDQDNEGSIQGHNDPVIDQKLNGNNDSNATTSIENGNLSINYSGREGTNYVNKIKNGGINEYDEDSDESVDPLYSVDKSMYNKEGFSSDATSSPHLKRRHANL